MLVSGLLLFLSIYFVLIFIYCKYSKLSGEKLRTDLRKIEMPANKLAALELKFDEAMAAGLLLPTASTPSQFYLLFLE